MLKFKIHADVNSESNVNTLKKIRYLDPYYFLIKLFNKLKLMKKYVS